MHNQTAKIALQATFLLLSLRVGDHFYVLTIIFPFMNNLWGFLKFLHYFDLTLNETLSLVGVDAMNFTMPPMLGS